MNNETTSQETAITKDRETVHAGDYGTATAGYAGTATVGDYGVATAGNHGIAIVGTGGTGAAGNYGEIRIRYYDTKANYCMTKTGYVGIGENQLKANVAYKLDENNEFVEA